MTSGLPSFFHLHLVSDATGETLTTIAKAASVQYAQVRPIEHVHPLVRTARQLKRVLQEIEQTPGIVLYTIVNRELTEELERRCRELKVPCLAVLQPIMQVFESYLGAPQTPTVAGQHVLDADYFRRIDALNFTMAHDDGQLPDDLNDADIIVLGISRTSKTPTSIYLAQRGYKTANLPLVPTLPLPERITKPHTAFVVCLVASPDRIAEVRRNRAHDARRPQSRRLCRSRPHRRRDRLFAQAVRAARLADHRRDAPLGRGNGGDDPEAPARSRGGQDRGAGCQRRVELLSDATREERCLLHAAKSFQRATGRASLLLPPP